MIRKKVPTKVIRLELVLPLRLAGKIFALLDQECGGDEQLLQFVTNVYDTEKEILDYDEYEKSIQPEKSK
ncbi:MAG: hypothetical protein K6D37_08525 [Prevotella sp.]|nr:hypothetical protein [Prevotella sp.]